MGLVVCRTRDVLSVPVTLQQVTSLGNRASDSVDVSECSLMIHGGLCWRARDHQYACIAGYSLGLAGLLLLLQAVCRFDVCPSRGYAFMGCSRTASCTPRRQRVHCIPPLAFSCYYHRSIICATVYPVLLSLSLNFLRFSRSRFVGSVQSCTMRRQLAAARAVRRERKQNKTPSRVS